MRGKKVEKIKKMKKMMTMNKSEMMMRVERSYSNT